MELLRSDASILLCVKPAGVLSTDEPGGVPSLAREALGDASAEVYTVHRLDRVAAGLMLLARSREAAAALGRQIMAHGFEKEYLAVVHGAPVDMTGTFRDLLLRDRRECKTYPVSAPQKGAQEAVLDYRVLQSKNAPALSLVRVTLRTGRTHQIRAQLSARGLPLVGDRKYGHPEDACPLALWSYRLAFDHPESGERVDMTLPPPEIYPWTEFAPC